MLWDNMLIYTFNTNGCIPRALFSIPWVEHCKCPWDKWQHVMMTYNRYCGRCHLPTCTYFTVMLQDSIQRVHVYSFCKHFGLKGILKFEKFNWMLLDDGKIAQHEGEKSLEWRRNNRGKRKMAVTGSVNISFHKYNHF